jgi:hypothetical protein
VTRRHALAAVLAAAALVLDACAGAPTDPVTPPSTDTVRALLADSWVGDGNRGFFVDASSPSAFSLYDTEWNLHLAERTGRGDAGLNAEAVARWLQPALAGEADADLPLIAQLDGAVRTLTRLGRRVDPVTVARTLAGLHRPGGYASGKTISTPDWGSTAIAVHIESTLGLPVPADVISAASRAISAPTAGMPVARRIALVQISANVPIPSTQDIARAAEAALADTPPDAAWLAAEFSLREATQRLHIPLPALGTARCRPLVNATGTVTLPGQRTADPQATFYADWLGCGGGKPMLPPHSRAGWPTRSAVEKAIGVSVDAFRIARDIGVDGDYAAPLTRQVREVWLPGLRGKTPASDPNVVNVKLLATALGPSVAVDASAALPLGTAEIPTRMQPPR